MDTQATKKATNKRSEKRTFTCVPHVSRNGGKKDAGKLGWGGIMFKI